MSTYYLSEETFQHGVEVDSPYSITFLIRFPNRLSGMWFSVAPRMDTTKICVYKSLDWILKNDSILGSTTYQHNWGAPI